MVLEIEPGGHHVAVDLSCVIGPPFTGTNGLSLRGSVASGSRPLEPTMMTVRMRGDGGGVWAGAVLPVCHLGLDTLKL